jgi:hypothetical protein
LPNLLNFERPRPKLKPKPNHRNILSIIPQPPTVHRPPPDLSRENNTLPRSARRENKPLNQSIDYDGLTPTQQVRWDLGLYGHIELKTIHGFQYYYLRWRDPNNNRLRSTYLGKEWNKAIVKLRKLTGH